MAFAQLGDIRIAYEDHGLPDDPALVLIAGLANQLIFFEDEFVQGLVDRAFRVIRFDNRDVGLSTILDEHPVAIEDVLAALGSGEPFTPPYRLSDMAGDVVGLLDHLAVARAHLLGVSLGGMVAQSVAIEHPERVQSLTLLSSTTGSPEVGQPTPESLQALLAPAPDGDRAAVVDANVASRRVWATAEHFDDDWAREYFGQSFDRSNAPGGTSRQLAAVLLEPDRESLLEQITSPALVLHGTDDKLIAADGGERLAALIPDATYVELDGMGHDLPPHFWAPVIEAVTQLAVRSLN